MIVSTCSGRMHIVVAARLQLVQMCSTFEPVVRFFGVSVETMSGFSAVIRGIIQIYKTYRITVHYFYRSCAPIAI